MSFACCILEGDEYDTAFFDKGNAGVPRESLHRALSKTGNPRLSTLAAVTKAVGLRLTVEAAG